MRAAARAGQREASSWSKDRLARMALGCVLLNASVDQRGAEAGNFCVWGFSPHLLHPNTRISGKFHSVSVGRHPFEGASVPAIRALDKLEDILASSENFLQRMHERGNDPHQSKQLNRLFSPSEAAEMVGRDRTTLARAEAELGMESLQRNPNNNRRMGYSLAQIQDFRQALWHTALARCRVRFGGGDCVSELQRRSGQVHDLR